ncbi:MAG: family 78 glycoside hydrolase catalytic domain [Lentisphaeria bacterium]|nr:family 78 glycoside hydrolase catalytic domain [Lentisphaeria bacterium]
MNEESSLSGFPPGRDWNARWIWNMRAPAKNAYVLFRAEFDLVETEGTTLYISADTRYRTWINGALLGDGPPQSQPYHQYYDRRNIAGTVRAGRNCIAVLVHHQGVQEAARGGLLVEIVDKKGLVTCASDKNWRTCVGAAWKQNTHFFGGNKIGPFQEHVDLRAMPTDWRTINANVADWDAPEDISGRGGRPPLVMPWCRMIPRDIAFLHEKNIYADRIHRAEECLDLANRMNAGDLSISLSQAGRPLDWATAEKLDNLLRGEGETLLACSDRHRDRVTDGRYDPCVTLDFGRVLTGYAEIEVEAPAGALVEIGYAERLVDERFNNAIECPFADRVIFADGRNVFRPLIWRSFRYLRLRVKQCEASLKIRALRAVEVTYPYEKRGAYHGDTRMEKVFDICRNTLKLCSIESLMDTPFREQAQWLGDVAAVTVPGIYACFGDTELPGKFLRQSAMNTRPSGLIANISNVADRGWQHDIPDYSLWWVIALWRHYQYTGDVRYIHECYPETQRIMRAHLERLGPDGLLKPMFGWVFIDWAHVEVNGVSAAYNAIFAAACDAAGKIAGVKTDAWAENAYTSAADGVRRAFASAFIRPENGVVADAVTADGTLSPRTSEHANAAAIAFDCVDAATADRIIDVIFDQQTVPATEAQPFFMVVVLEALRERGRTDLALRLIDERWGKRMVDRGRTSCTEEWYENGSWRGGDWAGFERTHSHAWSACPAEFLITGLAGIQILTPGCGQLKINPYPAAAPYAITYPTPRGDVRVTWDGARAAIHAPDTIHVVGP